MSSNLTILALTGGIATGKSTCCAIMQVLSSEVVVFDADQSVANAYTDPEVVDILRSHFGSDIHDEGGGINKSWLRARVFSHGDDRKFLEQVFHPRVRKDCLALLEQEAKNPATRLFVADIPLLFESGFEFGQSANLLVATSRQTQIDRLKNRNGWDDDTVEAVLSSQMSIEAKLQMADVVFWNEGPEQMLRNQCRRFLQSFAEVA
ncbi:MAG: dephospho-CoA kinase [Akkermansiaceae bacterium]